MLKPRRLLGWVGAALLIIPLAAGLNPRPAYASAYLTQRNVVYNGAGQRLDVYKPAASGHANRPIVVLVHGGG